MIAAICLFIRVYIKNQVIKRTHEIIRKEHCNSLQFSEQMIVADNIAIFSGNF